MPGRHDAASNEAVHVPSTIDRSEMTRPSGTGPFLPGTSYPELAAENTTVAVRVPDAGGAAPATIAVDQAAVNTRRVPPAMVAPADPWRGARPGGAPRVPDDAVSGASFASLADRDASARSVADPEVVVGAARAAGLEVDDAVWNWHDATASG